MRRVLARFAFSALSLALALPASLGLGAKMADPQVPVDLAIIGPRSIHKGQKLKFKAVLTNRSSLPIVVASRDASLDFDFRWKIIDSFGLDARKPLFQGFECPVGGPGWDKNLVRQMKDSDLTFLQPGDKLEFLYDSSAEYIFRKGKYQVTATYTYVPPRVEGNDGVERDSFGQKYDLTDLSPQMLETLKRAATVSATSTSTLVIE